MIGSRLLFSGYGIGYKSKPLHAGFLGQDALLVHDEAHLEPAFQEVLNAIEREQLQRNDFRPLRIMEMTATSRGVQNSFELSDEERNPPTILPGNISTPIHHVWKRLRAKKELQLHSITDEKNELVETLTALALTFKDSAQAVIVFVRRVEDVEKIVSKLRSAKQSTIQLTGTLRGLERDALVDDPIFQRFLPNSSAGDTTVYLVCTSAGEVGVNISADHLICDLSTFESMAQRFGRVNRFGDREKSEVHVILPKEFDQKDEYEVRRFRTKQLLVALNGDGCPFALSNLNSSERLAAFTPPPTILPTSEILFDSWAMTTVRGKLPGRPTVEPFLHGVSIWEPPETQVAWRNEVGIIVDELIERYDPNELLEDFPLKPHELLRDNTARVFDRLKKLKADAESPVWLVSDEGSVQITNLRALIDAGRDELQYKTVVLPPNVGGLESGLLTSTSTEASDVADEIFDGDQQRRIRLFADDPRLPDVRKKMRLIREIDLGLDSENEQVSQRQLWYWYEVPAGGDGDGSKAGRCAVDWQVHTDDVTRNVKQICRQLSLPAELGAAVALAAKLHDLGKKRILWQRRIGNPNPTRWLAKSGSEMKQKDFGDTYRHELGSIIDALDPNQSHFDEFSKLDEQLQDVVLHLIAVHHGLGRPHFQEDYVYDPEPKRIDVKAIADQVPQRFARLQRKFGRWGTGLLGITTSSCRLRG